MSDGVRCDPRALRLVAITDSLRDGIDGLVWRATAAAAGGATMLQLRLKDESARTLVEVARRMMAAVPALPLLINDRVDVALAAGAAGVHLGIDDVPPAAVRRIVRAGFIIGASVEGAEGLAALADVDYVAVGPVFTSGASPDGRGVGLEGVAKVATRSAVPVLAVGGVDAGNAAAVLGAGACGVGVISAVFGAADPTRPARAIRDALDATGR